MSSTPGHVNPSSLPLRLPPNSDLRRARLRLAGKDESQVLEGDLEILTLAGSISCDGAHLHMSLADANGRVLGGHVGYDCIVRTTAEVLLLLLPEWSFRRAADADTGFRELVIGEIPDRGPLPRGEGA